MEEETIVPFSNKWYSAILGCVKTTYSPYTVKPINLACKSKKPKPPKK